MKLTPKQDAFVDFYIETGNATKAAEMAGYSKKTARQTGSENLAKPYIRNEIDKRLKEIKSKRVAKRDEVLEFYTSVLRGEVQEEVVVVESKGFNSNARVIEKQVSGKDRINAAKELAKRFGLDKPEKAAKAPPVLIINNLPDSGNLGGK